MELDRTNDPSTRCYDAQAEIQDIIRNPSKWVGHTQLERLEKMKELCSQCETGHCIGPCMDGASTCKLNNLLNRFLTSKQNEKRRTIMSEVQNQSDDLFRDYTFGNGDLSSLSVDYMNIKIPLLQHYDRVEEYGRMLDDKKWLMNHKRSYYKIDKYNHPIYGLRDMFEVDDGQKITIHNYMKTGQSITFKLQFTNKLQLHNQKMFKCIRPNSSEYIVAVVVDEKEYYERIRRLNPHLSPFELRDMLMQDKRRRLGSIYINRIVMYDSIAKLNTFQKNI